MCVSKRGHWGAIGVPWQEFPKGGRRGKEKRGRNAPPNEAKTDRQREQTRANPSKPLAPRLCVLPLYFAAKKIARGVRHA